MKIYNKSQKEIIKADTVEGLEAHQEVLYGHLVNIYKLSGHGDGNPRKFQDYDNKLIYILTKNLAFVTQELNSRVRFGI